MKFRLLALPLIAAGFLSAQGPGPHRNSLTPPTASEVLQRQVDFLTKFYSLTASQVRQDIYGGCEFLRLKNYARVQRLECPV